MIRISHRPGLRRALVPTLAAVGVLAATAAFASAAPAPVRPSPALSARGAIQTALRHARQTRRTVPVPELTTQTSTTAANPNGTFTSTTYVMPVRVFQHGGWVRVNAALRRNANGTYSPAATPSRLTLSGGGGGPLVVMTRPSGASLALTFPFRLSAPVVSGATATYRKVLPGVDLVVTVTNQGAFSDVLVVHDAVAAAALRRVRIGTVTRGLTVRADRYGNVSAVGADGRVAFVAPVPRMWDSAPPPARAAAPGRFAQARQAHVADIGLTAVNGALVLTPDARMLAARSTRYPVYIDPVVNPASSGTNGFVEIQHGIASDGHTDCATITNFNNASTAPLGIGNQNFPGTTCQGIYRSYFQIDTHNLNSSMHVSRATLLTAETWASDLTCSHTWPVTLEWTGPIGPGTDGYNQPGVTATLATMNPKSAAAGCGTQDVNFDVTSNMQNTAANNLTTWTFGLFGDETNLPDSSCAPSSSFNCGFMRFADNPSITTVFDIAPNAPTNPATTPVPHDANGTVDFGCNLSNNYGWIGRTDIGAGNGSSVTLNATVTTNIVGENVQAQWTVFDNSAPNNPVGSNVVATPDSVFVPSGTTVDTPVGIALQDGHQYGFRAWAYDGTLGSATPTSDCHFNVDLSPPTVPVVTSTDFPPSGSATSTNLRVGQTGAFSVSSSDPAPATCVSTCMASGLAKFEYSFNTPIPAVGATTVPPGTAISFTPSQWGTNILYVDAVDNAGNRSQVARYDFYVPWDQAAPVTPGDINGDGVPDLLVTNADGNLLLYPGGTDPAIPAVTAGAKATSPDGTGWNTFQLTHRGSMRQGSVDDLFAHKGANLYIYTNGGGTSGQFENTANVTTPLTKPACSATADNANNCATYPTGNWSAVSQLLAPGDVYQGDTSATGPGDNGLPSLLTVENDQLWLYQGGFGDQLKNPVLIGASGWNKMTLIGPGTVGGVLSLWARDTTTGDLYSYPLTLDASGFPASLGPATGTGSTGTLIGAVNLPAGTYPTLASPGDVTGGGFPGLYAEDTSGNLWYYLGQSTAGGASPLTGARSLIGVVDDAFLSSYYQPLTPNLVLDTGTGLGTGGTIGPLAAGGTLALQVTGVGGVPSAHVTAVAINITATGEPSSGAIVAYPDGTIMPGTSTLNYAAGTDVANLAIVPVGADGKIDLRNLSTGTAGLLGGLYGYFTSDPTAAGDTTYTPITATRILDTRNGTGAPKAKLTPSSNPLKLQIGGANGIPWGVCAVAINLAAVANSDNGNLVAWADGTARPNVAAVQFNHGLDVAAMAIVPVGADGKIDIAEPNGGTTDELGDVSGYFTAGTGGEAYHAITATRLADTRTSTAVSGGGTLAVTPGATVVAATPDLILNVTATEGAANGNIVVYPAGASIPAVSNVNFAVDETIANLALGATGNGTADIHNNGGGMVQLVVDCLGYFSGG